jgi:hypothetical protein
MNYVPDEETAELIAEATTTGREDMRRDVLELLRSMRDDYDFDHTQGAAMRAILTRTIVGVKGI